MINFQSKSDEEIIEIILKSGETDAFGILYDRYVNKIYNKCLSMVDLREKAEDITHDIFLKVFLKLSTFKSKSQFSTWLFSISYFHIIDYLRKNQYKIVQTYENMEEFESSEKEVDDSELFKIEPSELREILNKVNPEDKLILLMKYQNDLSIKEIQEYFGVKESAAKMRILRAKEKVYSLYIKEKIQN